MCVKGDALDQLDKLRRGYIGQTSQGRPKNTHDISSPWLLFALPIFGCQEKLFTYLRTLYSKTTSDYTPKGPY